MCMSRTVDWVERECRDVCRGAGGGGGGAEDQANRKIHQRGSRRRRLGLAERPRLKAAPAARWED